MVTIETSNSWIHGSAAATLRNLAYSGSAATITCKDGSEIALEHATISFKNPTGGCRSCKVSVAGEFDIENLGRNNLRVEVDSFEIKSHDDLVALVENKTFVFFGKPIFEVEYKLIKSTCMDFIDISRHQHHYEVRISSRFAPLKPSGVIAHTVIGSKL